MSKEEGFMGTTTTTILPRNDLFLQEFPSLISRRKVTLDSFLFFEPDTIITATCTAFFAGYYSYFYIFFHPVFLLVIDTPSLEKLLSKPQDMLSGKRVWI